MLNLFTVLLSFSKSLACDQTKCLFLNDEPCMVRPTLIDMNPNELIYCQCRIQTYFHTVESIRGAQKRSQNF